MCWLVVTDASSVCDPSGMWTLHPDIEMSIMYCCSQEEVGTEVCFKDTLSHTGPLPDLSHSARPL